MALNDSAGGSIRPFCEPAIVTSMPHASCCRSSTPSDEIVSTMSSAGCFCASIALRISSIHERQPVEVSLCTTHTALIWCALSCLRRASIRFASAPMRQSVAKNSGTSPSFSAITFHSSANCPVSTISTWSPGDSVLTRAASQAPVPDEGKMTTGFSVLKIVLTLGSTLLPSCWNAGPRWSRICCDIALRMRSGTGVGPGICRKWRPGRRGSFDIEFPRLDPCGPGAAGAAAPN